MSKKHTFVHQISPLKNARKFPFVFSHFQQSMFFASKNFLVYTERKIQSDMMPKTSKSGYMCWRESGFFLRDGFSRSICQACLNTCMSLVRRMSDFSNGYLDMLMGDWQMPFFKFYRFQHVLRSLPRKAVDEFGKHIVSQ